MDTLSFNFGCGLIATAPLFAGHFIFAHQSRYILLSWLCSFVATIFLIISSVSCYFTKNPWFILLFGTPFDVLGKCILKYLGCKQEFLKPPSSRISIGMACGLGYALAHVLTLYIPIVMDQPFSIDYSHNHPVYFPNSLDLAIAYNAASVFQMGICLLFVRFDHLNIFLAFFILLAIQYGYSSLSMIPIIWLKLVLMAVIGYASLIVGAISFRSMKYQEIPTQSVPDPDEANDQEEH